MNAGTESRVAHDAAASRFTISVDGQQAELQYQREGEVMVITHTEVPPAIGGRGIAAQLAKVALEYARAQGWKVRPACAFAEAYLRKHNEYSDLLA